jgi:hypothetical protein
MRKHLAAAAGSVAVALVAGCGSSESVGSDSAVRDEIIRGVSQIRGARDGKGLYRQLAQTLERLRAAHGSTPAARAGRRLAIQGFKWTLRGVKAQLDLVENDSGNIEAATRDAKRSDRYLHRGAQLLRAAGVRVGVPIGKLNGH